MDKIFYYIYHIPTFVHKDGKIGKIGCSEEPQKRINKQGYTKYEILEVHTNIYEVSKREQELQKQYGYPVDNVPYFLSRNQWGSKAGKKGGKVTKQKHPNLAKEIGLGNAKSGLLKKISKLGVEKTRKEVLQYTKNGDFIGKYKSLSEASRKTNVGVGNIWNSCTGYTKTGGGYIWKYAT